MPTLWILACWMMGHEWEEKHTRDGKTYLICKECDAVKRL